MVQSWDVEQLAAFWAKLTCLTHWGAGTPALTVRSNPSIDLTSA
jgi:hypothetical protein